jgi:hypothetical protein
MQASHTAHNFHQEDNEYKRHKPIKHIRSQDNNDQTQYMKNQSSVNQTRSISSSFRHSIRHLTSCASAR